MPLEGVRILLVTRDRPVHDRIRTLCSRIAPTFRGLEWTGTYRAALDAVETDGVDICILDTTLVNGAGMNLLREPAVRRRHIPVVLLLDRPPPPDEDPLTEPGVADWIVKDELHLSSLQRALRHARKGRDASLARSRVGTALRAPGLPLGRRLERIAEIVCAEGVLANRATDARIVLHGKEFRTRGFETSAETHSIPIRSEDGEVGVLEVVVSGEEEAEPSATSRPMAELLDRIARELGTIPPHPDEPQH